MLCSMDNFMDDFNFLLNDPVPDHQISEKIEWDPLDAKPRYSGQFWGADRSGSGTYQWTEKGKNVRTQYDGDFHNNMMHGSGVLTWQDGRVFKGQFRENKFDGIGVMTWPDGRRYIGEYRAHKKHGIGSFLWPDGRKYEGQYSNGKRHGIGVYLDKMGIMKKGVWREDELEKWDTVLNTQEVAKDAIEEIPLPSLLRPSKDGMHSKSQKAQDLSINPRNAQFIARRQGASERGAEDRSESDKVIKQAHLTADLEREEEDKELPPLLWFLEDAVESVANFLSGASLPQYLQAVESAPPYPSPAPASLHGYIEL
eukprot:gnl/MRDRNA2_/MRDRNA2_88030_c0_seq1.p1 gnl/MRDRNA2_/MRDRNA2_88030_c0~~gnl/MRDRNA2_/MRDRNA2_88030_c0_seq1.p1  ORF type:complete len:312 (-),score=54.34 gnl/MRDRNA2_/MRDRNA2_88030_c0_seq1:205-1140(-)